MQVRGCIAAVLFLAALCSLSVQAKPEEVKVSEHAPGGLDPRDTPQFILWSHDDEVNKEASEYVLKITKQRQNPNGCDIPITWFACTSPNCGFSCKEALHLHDLGHELATHTVTHAGLRWMDRETIEEEVGGAKDELVRCGLPADEVAGFRTPYLADKPEVRTVLSELGFRYDSTIGVRGGPDKPWPATMESGVPFDCGNSGNDCDEGESYPGMWEVPLYVAKSGNLMDPCTYEGDGSDRPGCSVFKKLAETFDEAYGGNRAPVTVGVHKPWMSKQHHSKDLGKFMDYALAHPDVWVVTHTQLLDWMADPVPASKMKRFMAKYPCSS